MITKIYIFCLFSFLNSHFFFFFELSDGEGLNSVSHSYMGEEYLLSYMLVIHLFIVWIAKG